MKNHLFVLYFFKSQTYHKLPFLNVVYLLAKVKSIVQMNPNHYDIFKQKQLFHNSQTDISYIFTFGNILSFVDLSPKLELIFE